MATPEELARAAQLAENQQNLNKQLQQYIDLKAEANALGIDELNIEAEKATKVAAEESKRQEIRNINAEIARIQGEMVGVDATTLANLQLQLNVEKARKDVKNDELAVTREQKKLIEDILKTQQEYGKEVERNLQNAERQAGGVGKLLEKFAGRLPVIGGSLTKLLGQKENLATLGAGLTRAAATMGGVMGPAVGALGSAVTGLASAITLGASAVFGLLAAAGKMALEFDNLSKEIGRTTGFGDKFNNTLQEGYKATLSSGVSMKEYAQALSGLTSSFSGFNPNAAQTIEHLASTASRLEKLGVATETSAKLMDHFHRAMGVSAESAADMTAQLVMMGREVGITTSKMASDFQASAGIIARYGNNNMKVFKQLAAQAKATGLEMGSLLGMVEQFDHFDTAAEAASKLNAVLGTQLSTIELMNMNESERIDMIKQQVQASVGNFDSLDKFTKMYVTQAIGAKNVADAQRLMNMSMAERNALAAGQKEQADIQAELAEATAALVPLMTKLKIVGIQLFMMFEPLIKGMSVIFKTVEMGIAHLTDAMDDAQGVTLGLKIAFVVIGATLATVAGLISAPVAGVVALVAALSSLYDIVHLPGSKSLAEGLFIDIGKGIETFGKMLMSPMTMVDSLASSFMGLFGATHPDEGIETSFDIQAMANLDTSKIASGFNEIKSAVMELSNIQIDGFLAMSTEGGSSSFVMGSDGLIKSITEGKLIVDVNMPEMSLPPINVVVEFHDNRLIDLIDARVDLKESTKGAE